MRRILPIHDLPDPLDGGIRSTPLEAAPAVESLERKDNEYIALSGDLVVEVRGVVLGDLDLELTIRMSDECGDAHEVCGAALEHAACHPAPEEMSSDAVSDTSAGAALGNFREAMRVDDETSGDGREVRAEIISNARTRADAGKPADAVIDACAGAGRDDHVVAPCLDTAEIETDGSKRMAIEDATTALDAMQTGNYSGDIRMGALDPVRIRAGARSEMSLAAHARFLQYVFRRSQSRAESMTGTRSAWTRGGLAAYFPMMRPVHAYRCHSSGVCGRRGRLRDTGRTSPIGGRVVLVLRAYFGSADGADAGRAQWLLRSRGYRRGRTARGSGIARH